ncbi:MAG: DUF3536 domain-containing protein [Anaerolineales bacterium]
MPDHFFCVHGHFYQPPRGNPFDDRDEVGVEPGAEPYRNLNEKVTAECYAPNASLGNFGLMSFNFGAHLAGWLEQNAPETYSQIVAADRGHAEQWGVGNALAQPAHHTILPLCPLQDKSLQVRWGAVAFEQRFGRAPEGMWLPEMAMDLETLQTFHDNGIKFTVLTQGQVRGANEGAGPYWVRLPSGDRLAIYVRDDWHSNQLAFNIQNLGGAGRWARTTLAPLRRDYPGRLLLLATNGETYGHYFSGEEHFLHWLLSYEAGAVGFEVTTLARDLRDHPPTTEVEINEYTAWNCEHGLARWSTGCDCTPGDTRWKSALRRAFDNLARRVDDTYFDCARRLEKEAWPLLENFIRVMLKQVSEAELLREHGLGSLPPAQAAELLALLRAEFYRQRMYVSSAFFYEDLDRPEPRYALANAARAIALVRQATESDLTPAFRRDLTQAVSNRTDKTGAQLLDEVVADYSPPGEAEQGADEAQPT